MAKSKIMAVAAAAALAAMLALSACGGQATSSSAASSSATSGSASASSASSSATASSSASSAAASSSSATSGSTSLASQLKKIVAWTGALENGSLVSYTGNKDGTQAALSIASAGSNDTKTWKGATTFTEENGTIKQSITDDATNEAINFTWTGMTKDLTLMIDIEGYGKGALVGITISDYRKLLEAEKYLEENVAVVGYEGALEDGSIVAYAINGDGTKAAIAITPAGTNEMKKWKGATTSTEENGNVKQTITDDTSKETITFTWTGITKDFTMPIEIEGYGKGALVAMSAADFQKLEELQNSMSK